MQFKNKYIEFVRIFYEMRVEAGSAGGLMRGIGDVMYYANT